MAIPGFAAESSLVPSKRRHRHSGTAGAVGRTVDLVPQQGVSGVYFGTHCLPGGTLSEVYIDIDRTGRMVGLPHLVQVGSCRFTMPR
jgi:hypothetical protein